MPVSKLYHIKTIFNIIIIGLEAQPSPKIIILLLHSYSGGKEGKDIGKGNCLPSNHMV